MRPAQADPVGCYFTRFAAATGESIEAAIVSRDQVGAEAWLRFSHATHDAHGALWHHDAARAQPLELPRSPGGRPPRMPAQLVAMVRGLVQAARAPRPTLAVDYARAARGVGTTASRLLSAAQTEALRGAARAHQVNLTALLVWTLHRALGRASGRPAHTCRWSLPISLRGSLPTAAPAANQVAPIMVSLDGATALEAVGRDLRAQLARNLHWGMWRQLALLARVPPLLYEALIRADERAARARGDWFAIFSNVGACRGDPRIVARTAFALTGTTTPLAATALTWNGRLSLALQVRAGVGTPEVEAAPLLATWLAELATTAGVAAEAAWS